MPNIGRKTVTAGKSIYSTTLSDYLIYSKYYNLKALATDPNWPTQVTVLSGNEHTTATFTHSLGYKPLYDAYFQDQAGYWWPVPGKSTKDAFLTSAMIISEDVNSFGVILGNAAAAYGANTTYNLFALIYVDPNAA